MDLYWGKLRDIYDALGEASEGEASSLRLPDSLTAADRWKQAYQKMQEEMGTYLEPGLGPTFDPPATTSQEFASQYAESIAHMMATHSSHLELPKDFMSRWHKVETTTFQG